MKVINKDFETKRALKGKFKQYGSHIPSSHSGFYRPNLSRLRLYERIGLMDNLVEAGLDAVCNEVVGTIGRPAHNDPEITEFLNYMLDRMEDECGYSIHDCFYHMLKTELWAGYQVTEPLFYFHNGKLMLEDLVTYHPSTIIIVPDKNGRLREGRKTHSDYRLSGIYQQSIYSNPEVRIPMWKTLYTAHQARFGNYYGRSIISSIYKWHRLRETLIDMMVIALDRFGNPLLWVRTSNRSMGKTRVNPSTNEEYEVSPQQEVSEQMEELQSGGNMIVLPQSDPDVKPEIGSLTTGNDIGSTFLEAIDYASEQIAIGLYPPFFLLSDRAKTDNDILIERRVDQFKNLVQIKRNQLVKNFCNKVLWPIIKFNFSKSSIDKPPTLSYVQSARQEKLVDKMQAAKGLTEDGYLNPKDESDWAMVREMFGAKSRKMEPKDKQFIEKMLIKPKEKEGMTNGSSNNRSSTTNSSTKKTSPSRGKQGSGNKGRPTGSSNSQINPRSSEN
jgi:hypothetical protein